MPRQILLKIYKRKFLARLQHDKEASTMTEHLQGTAVPNGFPRENLDS